MPLARIKQKGQVTIPAEIRQKLGLDEGDYVQVTAEGGRIVLTPQLLLDREQAWDRLFKAKENVRYTGPAPEPSEDEVMETVVREIKAMRREYARGRSR